MTGRVPHVSHDEGQVAEILERRVRMAVPEVAVARVRNGEIGSVATRGAASVISGAPMTSRTINPWFSMTKLVTATAAMQLADSGRITLDDSVPWFLPQISAPRSGPPMTVRDLLSHTSGLPPLAELERLAQCSRTTETPITNLEGPHKADASPAALMGDPGGGGPQRVSGCVCADHSRVPVRPGPVPGLTSPVS